MFNRAEVHRILDQVWRNFDELAPDIPPEPTFGSRMLVRWACVTLAFYRALLAAGIEKDYARTLLYDSLWLGYKKSAFLPRLISRLLSRDPQKRMRICAKMFMRFPFNPPGYRFEIVPDDDKENAIAVKWFRCCMIDYIRPLGTEAEENLLACGCNLDYALVEYWGGWFDRPCVQAVEGAEYCHMRFQAKPMVKR